MDGEDLGGVSQNIYYSKERRQAKCRWEMQGSINACPKVWLP